MSNSVLVLGLAIFSLWATVSIVRPVWPFARRWQAFAMSVCCMILIGIVGQDAPTGLAPVAVADAAVGRSENSGWSDREICRAAVKTYFFLDTLPEDASGGGGRFGFRSAAGNLYACRIEGPVAVFDWVNKSGETMQSRSTTFAVSGPRLRIDSDLLDAEFVAD